MAISAAFQLHRLSTIRTTCKAGSIYYCNRLLFRPAFKSIIALIVIFSILHLFVLLHLTSRRVDVVKFNISLLCVIELYYCWFMLFIVYLHSRLILLLFSVVLL